jgi:hypothetical protein
MPAPGSPETAKSVAGNDGAAQSVGSSRRRLTAGTWVGTLIYVLVLLFMIFFAVRVAQQHRWASLAGICLLILLVLSAPVAGSKWWRRVPKGPQATEPPSSIG